MRPPVAKVITAYNQPDGGWKARKEELVSMLYKKLYKKINFYVISNSGLSEDAEDVFQDALIVLLDKIDAGTLRLSCAIETFFFSVCKNLWFHRLANMQKSKHFQEYMTFDQAKASVSSDSYDMHDELLRLMRYHFSRLDEKSRQTLDLYMSGTPNKETTALMGYRNKDYAKTRKFICKEKLKSLIINDPAYKRLHLEMLEN
jgi:RNA polymerase sigma factor (sigma-70 family)